jgi:uncharacterized protein (TIGR02271 family)
MAKTVIGLFTDPNRAQMAMDELVRADIERSEIDLIRPDQRQQLSGRLSECGVPDDDARLFDLAVQRGHTLLMIGETDDDLADTAAEILDRHGAIDLDDIAPTLGQGEAAGAGTAPPMPGGPTRTGQPAGREAGMRTGQTTGRETGMRSGETARPTGRGAGEEIRESVVEEEMRIGKREVGRGGVRVFSRVTEKPVHEQVQLREEEIHVERHRVDRPATAEDFKAGQGPVEVRATGEEAVVQKRPHVVEEVVVSKEQHERTQEISDTLKRKDVEIEEIPGQSAGMREQDLDPEYRKHYQEAFGRSGQKYETIAPAYRYGSQLGADPRYRGRDWDVVRDEARRDWENRSPGTFERLENAIRYGYDRIRGKSR